MMFVSFLAVLNLAACSSAEPVDDDAPQAAVEETETGQDSESKRATESAEREVAKAEQTRSEPDVSDWHFETELIGDQTYQLRVYRDGELVVDHERIRGGIRRAPVVHDNAFATEFCGNPAIVVTLESEVSTGVSAGATYDNVVIDADEPKVLDIVIGAEMVDRQDQSVISDSQDETVESLRQGVDAGELCED